MANAYTDILSGASLGTNLVQTAYDRLVEFQLRAQPLFRAVADKRPAQQTQPGASVVFQLYQDLAAVSSALTETTDPDAVALSATTTVSVTLNEYGNADLVTRKLELFALSDVDPAIANIVAFNMADSLDGLAQTVLRGGTNIVREVAGVMSKTAATTGMVTTDGLKSRDVRYVVTQLRNSKVVPRKGNLYWMGIHPSQSYDLRAETGAAAWRDPHNYSAPDAIWGGELGQYEGAFFCESPRNYVATDAGSGGNTVPRYRAYAAGQQALAEAVAEEPHIVIGPVVDKLMRFRPIGWYGVLGWAIYRQPALWRVETASSIDAVT